METLSLTRIPQANTAVFVGKSTYNGRLDPMSININFTALCYLRGQIFLPPLRGRVEGNRKRGKKVRLG